MKFAKRILVGVLAVSLLVCGLAFSSSAETTGKTPAYYENIFEYDDCLVYFIESFDSYDLATESDYTNKETYAGTILSDGVLKFHGPAAVEKESEAENQYLKITASSDMIFFRWLKSDPRPTALAAKFSVKLGDADADNASTVALNVTMNDYYEDVPLITFNALDKTATSISYASFDTKAIEYTQIASSATVALGAWYDVNVVFNVEDTTVYYEVSTGGNTVFSATAPANLSVAGIDSVRLTVDNGEKTTETVTYVDNFQLYEGKVVRDIVNPDKAKGDFIIEMDAFAKDPARTTEEKLAMVDIYNRFFLDSVAPYVPDQDELGDKYEDVLAITNGAKAYINKVHADILIERATLIMQQADCYAKEKYQANQVKEYYDMFPAAQGDIEALDGMTDTFADTVTYADKVFEAKALYDQATSDIAYIKLRSESFLYQVSEIYVATNKDYTYMLRQREAMTILLPNVDPAYKYVGNPNSKYVTAADAIAEYNALVAKIADIEATANNFIPKANILSITIADSVSAASPYLTTNFPDLYKNYLAVKDLCEGQEIHPLLDSATYPGLQAAVDNFNAHKEYIEEREAYCNDFVALVNGAANAGLHSVTETQLNNAAKYLDNEKAFSLEDHTGVKAAIDLYASLREQLAANLKAAEDYKAAVAAINIEASYNDLSAQVKAAAALREAGTKVDKDDAVKAANLVLIEAEKKLAVFESNSETLKECIAKLKEEKNLSERRKLILTANAVKDKTNDAIDGVTAAKTELTAQIAQYDADVKAANELFGGIVSDVAAVSSAACPKAEIYKAIDVIKALLK